MAQNMYSVMRILSGMEVKGDMELRGIARSLLTAVRLKDESTYRHSKRVMYYSLKIAQYMGLNDEQIELLKWAALLHDLGKLVVSDTVLNDNGTLGSQGLRLLKNHQSLGVEILSPIDEMRDILPIIKGHHERYDGTGYPDGLCGEEIPLLSKIVAVADAYEAMIRVRPYNTPLSHLRACREMKKNAGVQFDPHVVDTFFRYLDDGDSLVSILIVEGDKEHAHHLFQLIDGMSHIRVGKGVHSSVITQAVRDEGYDLILAEISLPGTDGFELLRRMKKDFPSIRIVLMSTYSNLEIKKKAENLGAFGYLEKPVRHEELFDLVDRIVDEKITF